MATARPPIRRPAAAPAARPAARPAPASAAPRRASGGAPSPITSSGYRGAAGLQKMQEEQERGDAMREMRRQSIGSPFRFFCMPGETRQFVIVDEAPDFFRSEHNLKNPRTGRYDIYCACIEEHANCPVCANTERPAYFGMFFTIIDLTPYTKADGTEVPWSKKLLCVKSQQQKKYVRMYERMKAQGLTMRGAVIEVTRDGEKDAASGDPEWTGTHYDEEGLAEFYDSYVDQQNKTHEIYGGVVFDYDALFPMPTEEMLLAIVRGKAGTGSTAGDNNAIERGDNWENRPAAGAAPVVRRPARGPAPPPARPAPPAARPATVAPRRLAPARPAAPAPEPEPEQFEDVPDGGEETEYVDENGNPCDADGNPLPEYEEAAEEVVEEPVAPARVAPRQQAPVRPAPPQRSAGSAPARPLPARDVPPARGAPATMAERRAQLRR